MRGRSKRTALLGVSRAACATTAPAALPATSGARTATATCARRRRHFLQSIELICVDRLIPNTVAVLVHPPHRLLKQPWFRASLRHCAFEDVQLHLVHADERERARLVRVACQLELMVLDEIVMSPMVPCRCCFS